MTQGAGMGPIRDEGWAAEVSCTIQEAIGQFHALGPKFMLVVRRTALSL